LVQAQENLENFLRPGIEDNSRALPKSGDFEQLRFPACWKMLCIFGILKIAKQFWDTRMFHILSAHET